MKPWAGLGGAEPSPASIKSGVMSMSNLAKTSILAALAIVLVVTATPVYAHSGHGFAGGFISGFLHPILGWDHVVAMVAVGLWGAFLGLPLMWVLPVVFPLVMAVGGAMGVVGVPVPAVEMGIAASSLILGLLIAAGARAPRWIAIAIVGAFAIFHGHAHGTELPDAANPISYAIGFVLATGLMHAVGIALGFATRLPKGVVAVRAMGGVIAVAGLGFLSGTL